MSVVSCTEDHRFIINPELENPKFVTAWTTPANKRDAQIYFFANDMKFIAEVMELLAAYTKKVDPNAPITFQAVEKNDDPDFLPNLQREAIQNQYLHEPHLVSTLTYQYRAQIHNLLPRFVRLFYGFTDMPSNCHGSAQVSAGIYPILNCLERSSDIRQWLCSHSTPCKHVEDVSLTNIASGDLVYLPDQYDHSFVYLNQELCISTNGRYKPLLIHSLSHVLKTYHCSQEQLSTPRVRIMRKLAGVPCFESMCEPLLEFFSFYRDLLKIDNFQQHPKANQLIQIEQTLREYTLSVLRNPDLPIPTKEMVEYIYHSVCGRLDSKRHNVPDRYEILNALDSAAGRVLKPMTVASEPINPLVVNVPKSSGHFLKLFKLVAISSIIFTLSKATLSLQDIGSLSNLGKGF